MKWLSNLLFGAKVTASFEEEFANGNLGATPTIVWANGQKQKGTLNAGAAIAFDFTGVGIGHYQLRLIQDATGGRTVSWGTGTPGSGRWLGSASAPAINAAATGETIVSIFWDGTNATGSLAKVGAA